jgi:tetratricopeptide (TPR) repeat protein
VTCLRNQSAFLVTVGLLCLAVGCAHPPAEPVRLEPAISAPDLRLSAAEEREAEALALYAHALLMSEEGESEAALEQLREAAALDPGEVLLQLRIARELLRRDRVDDAIDAIDHALQHAPLDARLLVLRGVAHERSATPARARQDFEQALTLSPDDPAAYLHLRDFYLHRDDYNAASEIMERILARQPGEAHLWEQLADVYAKQAAAVSPEQAARLGEKIVDAYAMAADARPDDPNLLARLATAAEGMGHLDQAIAAYRDILELRSDAFLIRERLLKALIRAGREDEALEESERLAEEQPRIGRFGTQLAALYESMGRDEDAIEVFERLVEEDPLKPFYHFRLGELYEKGGDLDAAVSNFEAFLVLEPGIPQAYLRLALIRNRQDRYEDALAILENGIAEIPDSPELPYLQGILHGEAERYEDAVTALGRAETLALKDRPDLLGAEFYFRFGATLERLGRYDEAAQRFRAAIRLDDDQAETYNYLGYMFAEQGMNLDEAEQLVRRALEMEPDNGAYIDSLGWVFYQQGRYEEALVELQRAAERIGDDPVIFQHLGDVHEKLGNTDAARENWMRALEMDPDNEELQRRIGTDDEAPPPPGKTPDAVTDDAPEPQPPEPPSSQP